jgi:hypothetical protein
MAGGPNAAFMLCVACLRRAARTAEGKESDTYRCEYCAREFAVDWRRGAPTHPTWPPSEEELNLARALWEQRRKSH